MKLDWNTRINIRDRRILVHEKNRSSKAHVTIGIPTYRRAHLIRRALASIAAQSYRDFVLIISDNAGENLETVAAVKEFSCEIPEIILVAQDENIGSLDNFKFVLAAAETDYFMWLADDDEISPNYLEELVRILDADPLAVTAMGKWMHMTSPTFGEMRAQIRLGNNSRLNRLFRFVVGTADDSAFYGVHRADCLRQSNVPGYLPPNRGVLTNFCYLLLFDMLWLGRVRFGESATWICHNYSDKEYSRALASGVGDRIKTLLRRLNVYVLYISKTAFKGPMLVPVILVASILGFTRESASAAWRLCRSVVSKEGSGRIGH